MSDDRIDQPLALLHVDSDTKNLTGDRCLVTNLPFVKRAHLVPEGLAWEVVSSLRFGMMIR